MDKLLLFVLLAAPAGADRLAIHPSEVRGGGGNVARLIVLHGEMGSAAFQAGRYRDAKSHFERALSLQPAGAESRAILLTNLGQTCQALGEIAHAEQLYREALTAMPDRAGLWQLLGGVLVIRSRLDEAERALERALTLADAETMPNVRNDLAALYQARGQLRQALELLEEAASTACSGQARARILANLGMLHVKLGHRTDGAAILARAVEEMKAAVGAEHPDVVPVLRSYALVLRGAGQKEAARQAARHADAIVSSFAAQANSLGSTVDYRDLR